MAKLIRKLTRWSWSYFVVKDILMINLYDAYYKRVEEVNKRKLQRNGPIIIAPNHQNALMDPMAFAVHLPAQNVFLARADVFNKPLALKFLTWAKILPIYRIRDGISSLKKNDEIFETCVEVLKKDKKLVMFPEGNHGEKRRLRPLVKGVFRIAFKAQAKHGKNEGIKIIPVGVDYAHFQKFRQTLLIIYGDPIDVSEYWEQYQDDQAIAMNALRDKLAKEMKKLMIHIETKEYYDLYQGLRPFYNKKMRSKLHIRGNSLYAKFRADKVLIEKLDNTLEKEPKKIEALNEDFKKYTKLRDKLNLRDWLFNQKRYSIIINIFNLILCGVCSPIFLLGLFNNWPHFFIPPKMTKKIKDPQFISTLKWGVGTGILIVYYLLLTILALIFIPTWYFKIAYILLLPLSGISALFIRKVFIKSAARIRYTFLAKRNKKFIEAVGLQTKIHNQLDEICS